MCAYGQTILSIVHFFVKNRLCKVPLTFLYLFRQCVHVRVHEHVGSKAKRTVILEILVVVNNL